MLTSGQADFEVAHEPNRAFRVIAGSAEVVDLGTKFDVRLEHDSTVVTVVEGRVAVGPSNSQPEPRATLCAAGADQQIRVTAGRGAGLAHSGRCAAHHGLAASTNCI